MRQQRIRADAASSATLQDVADAAGVSIATASRAISGRSTVRPDLSERVFVAAARLGYRVSAAARATAGGHSAIVGLVGDDTTDAYFATIADGVAELAAEHRCIVMMAGTTGEDLDTVVRSLVGFRPRAIVIASRDVTVRDLDHGIVEQYRSDHGGISAVGTAVEWAPSVRLEDIPACTELAVTILAGGYRSPLVISGPQQYPAASLRGSALRAALSESGGPVHSVDASALDRDAGYRAVRSAITAGIAFDIVLAVGDMLAIGAISALRDAGITPGEEVGVTGFDDLQPGRDVVPALTTVDTSLRQAGRSALSLALRTDVAENLDQELEPSSPKIHIKESTPLL